MSTKKGILMTNDGYKQNCHDKLKKKPLQTKQHTHNVINTMTAQIYCIKHTRSY